MQRPRAIKVSAPWPSRRVFVLALALLFIAPQASAHGPIPAAVGLLGLSGRDATLVRLSRGLAQRVPDGFRLLCPEAWDGDVNAPAAAIPGGPALIAGESLYVVEADGRVSLHPSQPGSGIALASSRDAVFGLFARAGRHELWRISASTSELIRALDEPFRALSVDESEVAVLGFEGRTLVLQKLSLTGELGERVTWSEPSVVWQAELRLAVEQLFVVIWGSSTPWVSLGRVTEHGYEPLREAHTNIAGPVALDQTTLIALDGTLETLAQVQVLAGRDERVTCLDSLLGQPFACAHGDLLRIEPDGLGEPLFELTSLREPDYESLPEAARLDCSTRWLDLREHVAVPGASASADAGLTDHAAAAHEPTASVEQPSGCALGAGSEHAWWLSLSVLTGLAARRRKLSVVG